MYIVTKNNVYLHPSRLGVFFIYKVLYINEYGLEDCMFVHHLSKEEIREHLKNEPSVLQLISIEEVRDYE